MTKAQRLILFVLFAMSFHIGCALAQTNVGLPRVSVGDKYVIENFKSTQNRAIITERTVVSVDPNFIKLEIKSKSGNIRHVWYTHEWNPVKTRDKSGKGSDYNPEIKYFDFPLYLGKSWSQQTIESSPDFSIDRLHELNGTVQGFERITINGLAFDTIKILLKIEMIDKKTGNKFISSDTSWYCPAINRSVRSIIKSYNSSTGVADEDVVSVVSYKGQNSSANFSLKDIKTNADERKIPVSNKTNRGETGNAPVKGKEKSNSGPFVF